jgi:hypothetical protein
MRQYGSRRRDGVTRPGGPSDQTQPVQLLAQRVVKVWIREVQGERLKTERALLGAQPGPTLSADELRCAIGELGDLRPVLAEADLPLKREMYTNLGIRMTYRPADGVVEVTADPVGLSACRRDDYHPMHTSCEPNWYCVDIRPVP